MQAAACVVDVTRIASRLWRGAFTGIDRVELAYIHHIRRSSTPTFGLLRTGAGVILLGTQGLDRIERWARGAPIPVRRDLIAWLTRRRDPLLGRVETALRADCLFRAPTAFAGPGLRRHLPPGTVYLNTGHTNLTHPMMRALRTFRKVVLVHDTIPLDHPEYTRPDQITGFARKMAVVSAHADLVIHTAQATRTVTEAQLIRLGRIPPGIVAPLGVDRAPPDASALPPGVDLTQPYFITIGTIEPRKNHALLLDVWERLATTGPVPHLYILGNRGWAERALLDRLDKGVPGVSVLPGQSDGAMMALLAGARALLFPSHVEGFGLPPFEAAAIGIPVVCLPLPVLKEGLGDYPVYLHAPDPYLWAETIRRLTTDLADYPHIKPMQPPDWQGHFKTILNAL